MTSTVRRKKQQLTERWRDVLTLSAKKRSQSTVYRHYLQWREEQGIPLRCDNPCCQFYEGKLDWNGKPLKLILDHKEGNRYDNLPPSLRLLCPNCDSQLETKGGGNRGRVVSVVEGGYTLRNKDGSFIVAATATMVGKSATAFISEQIPEKHGA